ncbi:Glucan endo-1,3-beta-glucosidase 5 [Triticum urartu]|uniref:Glucan endo-1,3-beta-glucosidase 5 n=1 Tax=Triticum urartu TaxID=4572 RepID=M7YEF4_TRIUA|nr:Glucan endo-1,3-beta-glucosidase 5 [Triticum urartu]
MECFLTQVQMQSRPLPPFRDNGFDRVKLFDAEDGILGALKGSGIQVMVGIPNDMLSDLAGSTKAAERWVTANVSKHVNDGVDISVFYACNVPWKTFLCLNFTFEALLLNYYSLVACEFFVFEIIGLFNSDFSIMEQIALKFKSQQPIVAVPVLLLSNNTDAIGDGCRLVAVGNEPFLQTFNGTYLNTTFPAMQNIQAALMAAGLGGQVKVTVALNADVYQSATGKPSDGDFRADIHGLMLDIVQFLASSGAPFVANVYPFISLYADPNFPLDYAFFQGSTSPVVDGGVTYQNTFDANHDTLVAALRRNGFPNVTVVVGEVGWPTDGDANANPAADCTSLGYKTSCGGLDAKGNVSYAFNSYYQTEDQDDRACDFRGLATTTTVDPSTGTCRFIVGIAPTSAATRNVAARAAAVLFAVLLAGVF